MSQADARRADSIFLAAELLADSLRIHGDASTYASEGLLLVSVRQLGQFFERGLLRDSARFNRMVDHIAVTSMWVRGELSPDTRGEVHPPITPDLAWGFHAGVGIYFEPSVTVQSLVGFVPGAVAPPSGSDRVAEALWNYRLQQRSPDSAAPATWETDYTYQSCLQSALAPSVSAETQGAIVGLFTDLLAATGDAKWRQRANAAIRSLELPRGSGGVRLDDSSRGYWFGAALPSAKVWRAHVIAVLAALDYAKVTGDAAAAHLANEGLRAAKFWTPAFDTGSWTRPCLTSGSGDINSHHLFIALATALYERTGDDFWRTTADRWILYEAAGSTAGMQ